MRRPALVLLGIATCTCTAPAQGLLRLTSGKGELASEARADRRGYARGPGMQETSFREWLRLPLQGSLPSPQLFSYTLVFRPLVGQQAGTGLPQRYSTRATGTDLTVSMLQSRFGGATLFSTRQVGSAEGGLGGESFYATRGRGATLRLITKYLPLTFDVNDRRTDDTWRGAIDDVPFERSERMRLSRLSAAGSKTSVHVEHMDFNDLRGATTFNAVTAGFNHRARWGRGSVLESTFEHADRDGYDPFRRRTWTERLQLQHAPRVVTNWHLHSRSNTAFGIPSTGAGAGGMARVDLSRTVTATFQVDRSSSRFPNGSNRSTALAPRLSWRRTLGRRTWLQGSFTGRGEEVKRELLGGGYAEVGEERHRVEPSRSLQLERTNADIGSLVIRSADQTRTYREPEDYRAFIVGPVVRLQFPAGSRIATGDIIVVAYRYSLLQGTPYRLLGSGAEASLGSPWFHARYTIMNRDVWSRDGSPMQSSEQGTDDMAAFGLTAPVGRGHVELEVEQRRRTRSVGDYAVREARLLVLPPSRGRFTGSLGATVTRTSAATATIGVYSGNAALAWVPSGNFRFQGSWDAWAWRLADVAPERFSGLSALVGWNIGQLETEWRYGYQLRDQTVRGVEHRMWARVIRHF